MLILYESNDLWFRAMLNKVKYYWQSQPLWIILLLAVLVRIVAAIFSKGYAMSDDHFVVIHIAQRWLDGYNNWFNQGHPAAFSIVYPGLHYVLFFLLKEVGITDPQVKMLIVRLIHALYSILVVLFGYLIVLRLSNLKTARNVGVLLALFWILPFMSVRNLIEVVCIPPVLLGFYLIVLGSEENRNKFWFYAGLAFGLAFAFRYQTLIFPGGVGLVLLFQKEWRRLGYLTIGTVLALLLVQGLVDWIAWGYPLAGFHSYFIHNIGHRFSYVIGPWYQYLILILGIFIPPISFFLAFGFAKTWKKMAIIFWPALLFLIFHSYFPNKQERFILPLLPFIVILGLIGWDNYVSNSIFWKNRKKIISGCWLWFWIINSILLIMLTFTYPKKTRVEPLVYLSQKNDLKGIIIEYNKKDLPWFPRFYLEKKVPIYRLYPEKTTQEFLREIATSDKEFPNYIFFYGNDALAERVDDLEALLSVKLNFDHRINPGLIDNILYRLNPKHNLNLTSYIYKISDK
jgi:4-amino-4-deoxy-L-arabinose transferase-like glycosyltransferase